LAERVVELLGYDLPLPIVQAGDPVLRQRAAAFDGQLDDELLRRFIEAMKVIRYEASGGGHEAPQNRLGLQLAVLEDRVGDDADVEDPRERGDLPFRVIINPHYEPVEDDRVVAFYEGCLSVEGYQAVVARPCSVRLTGFDETGRALDEVVS